MHRLALFSFNELGFRESVRIATDYVARAMEILDRAERRGNRARKIAKNLRQEAERLKQDCEYLGKFHENREAFKRVPSTGAIEWTTKQAVKAISRGHLVHFHELLAHRIRRFHSEVSAVLNELSDGDFSFAKR